VQGFLAEHGIPYVEKDVSKDEVLDMMAGGEEMQKLMADLDGVTI